MDALPTLAPRIQSFKAENPQLFLGDSAYLSWKTTASTAYCELYENDTLLVRFEGGGEFSYEPSPNTSTDYTLRAYDANQSLIDAKTLSISVARWVWSDTHLVPQGSCLALVTSSLAISYVGQQGGILVLNADLETTQTISLAANAIPSSLVLSLDEKTLYVAQVSSTQKFLYQINTQSFEVNLLKVSDLNEADLGLAKLALSSDGRSLYILNLAENAPLQVFDIQTQTFQALALSADLSPNDNLSADLKLGSDGALYALLTGRLFKIAGQKSVEIVLPFIANSLAMHPSEARAYLTELNGNLYSLDLTDQSVSEPIELGAGSPEALCFDSRGQYLYISTQENTLVLNADKDSLEASLEAPGVALNLGPNGSILVSYYREPSQDENLLAQFALIRKAYYEDKKSIRWISKEYQFYRRQVREAVYHEVPTSIAAAGTGSKLMLLSQQAIPPAFVENNASSSSALVADATHRVLSQIDLSAGNAIFTAVSPDNAYVYVSHFNPKKISVIAQTSQRFIKSIDTSSYGSPMNIAFGADSAYAYVTCNGIITSSGSIASGVLIVALPKHQIVTYQNTGQATYGTDSQPNSIKIHKGQLYLADFKEKAIKIYNLLEGGRSFSVSSLKTVDINDNYNPRSISIAYLENGQERLAVSAVYNGKERALLYDIQNNYQLIKPFESSSSQSLSTWNSGFSPEGDALYNVGGNSLSVIDMDIFGIKNYPTQGSNASAVAVSFDNHYVYIANSASANASIFDISTASMQLLPISVSGSNFWNIAVSPDNRHIYLADKSTNTKLWVIERDLALNQTVEPLFTYALQTEPAVLEVSQGSSLRLATLSILVSAKILTGLSYLKFLKISLSQGEQAYDLSTDLSSVQLNLVQTSGWETSRQGNQFIVSATEVKKLSEDFIINFSGITVNQKIGVSKIILQEFSGLEADVLSVKRSELLLGKFPQRFALENFYAVAATDGKVRPVVDANTLVFLNWRLQSVASLKLFLQQSNQSTWTELPNLTATNGVYQYPASTGISIQDSVTFTLQARYLEHGLNQSQEAQYRVSVIPDDKPRIEAIKIDSPKIILGSTVNLRVYCNAATTACELYDGPYFIENKNIVNLQKNGAVFSYSHTPQASTDYILKAYDKNGILGDSRLLSTYVYRLFSPITITGGSGPSSIGITPNGQYAYVVNQGSGSVSVIDIRDRKNQKIVGQLLMPEGSNPISIVITPAPDDQYAPAPDDQYAYVVNKRYGSVSAIDIRDRENPKIVGQPVPVGSNPISIVITPDGQYAYVVIQGFGRVSAIDIRDRENPKIVGQPVPVGSNPISIVITPDGQYAYVVNQGSGSVSVIDIRDRENPKIVGQPVTVGSNPFSIVITPAPDGQYAYVANRDSHNVSVIDIRDRENPKIVGQLLMPEGSNPISIVITPAPDGQYAYVANRDSNNISVIDIRDRENPKIVGQPVPVGSYPISIVITPDGQYAYVANRDSNNISVIPIFPMPKPYYLNSTNNSNRLLPDEPATRESPAASSRLPVPQALTETAEPREASRPETLAASPIPFTPLATLRRSTVRAASPEPSASAQAPSRAEARFKSCRIT